MKVHEYIKDAKSELIKQNPFLADKKIKAKIYSCLIFFEVYSDFEKRWFAFATYNYNKKEFLK